MKSFLLKIALLLTVVGVVACSKSDIDEVLPQHPITEDVAQQGEVRIVIPGGTRSVLEDVKDENGNIINSILRWTSGDEITILAYDSNNSTQIMSPTTFQLVGNKHNGNGSYFTAIPDLSGFDSAANDATYNYYAISPAIEPSDANYLKPSLSGTSVSFTIPSLQNGEYKTDMDFMVAKASSTALMACTAPVIENDEITQEGNEPINNMDLMFYHRTHMLRFTIPENVTNNLNEGGIKKVYILFPDEVVGTMTVDMTAGVTNDLVPAPSFGADASKKIIVEFNDAKKAGDEFWVMTFPYVGGLENVDIRFEDKDGNVSQRRKVTFANMEANRVTPITLSTIPEKVGVTSFYYTEGTNNLGESLTSINIALPDGCYFTNYEQEYKASVDSNHNATFLIFSDIFDSVKNLDLKLFELESEHALIPMNNKKIGELKTDSPQETITVPYLFFEDFSGDINFADGHDNMRVVSNWRDIDWDNLFTFLDHLSDTYKGIKECSDRLSRKWYASRVGSSNGAVRICCRYENVASGNAYYKGRLYTPFIPYLKDGATVNVKVSFKYGSNIAETITNTGFFKFELPNKNPLLYFGVDNRQEESVTNPDDVTLGIVSGKGYADQAPSSLSSMSINGRKLANSGGSYTKIPNSENNITVSGVSNKSRLAWIVSSTNDLSNTNGNYWLYLDDIKVSISK